MFWARRAGPLLGLLWMDAGLARSPLCFWAGGWDIWPISLSLSAVIQPTNIYDFKCGILELRGDNYKVWKERGLLHLG